MPRQWHPWWQTVVGHRAQRKRKERTEWRFTPELLPDILVMSAVPAPSGINIQYPAGLQPFLLNVPRCETRDSIGLLLQFNVSASYFYINIMLFL